MCSRKKATTLRIDGQRLIKEHREALARKDFEHSSSRFLAALALHALAMFVLGASLLAILASVAERAAY